MSWDSNDPEGKSNTRRFDQPQEADQPTQRLDRANAAEEPDEEEAPALFPTACTECGSEMAWARTGDYMVLTRQSPGFIERGVKLSALVCLNCGYTKLYAQNPRRLIG